MYTRDADFLSNHSKAEIGQVDTVRAAAKAISSRLRLSASNATAATTQLGLKDDYHGCNNANPCSITCSPCYSNWDYILVDTPTLSSNSTINVDVTNGNANRCFGPASHYYWEGCCGPDKTSDCSWKGVTGNKYQGSCKGQGATYVSLWNNNYVEQEIDIFLFNLGIGPGPN
jgi:hypothetical protein